MRQFPALSSPWVRALITWFVYVATGVVALVLAEAQTQVAPLYLPAGFGLAFVLGWGRQLVWAVGLGSATVLIIAHSDWFSGQPPAAWVPLLATSCVTVFGAALQAWVADRWGPDRREPELRLEKPLHIFRFLLVAGPLACLINAGMTVSAMVVLGVLSPQQGQAAAVAWWAGDTLGVLIGTPIMLTLVGRPTALWQSRRRVVGIPLLATTLLLGLTINQVQRWDEERARAVFEHDVEALSSTAKLRLTGYVDAVQALHGLYAASTDVSRAEFRIGSNYWVNAIPGIQAVGWAESMRLDQVPAFEARQRAEGLAGYMVHDTRARKAPAGPRVLAIRYVEPLDRNEAALGYNVLSTPQAGEAFEQAVQADQTVASRSLTLAQESAGQRGVVLYHPVFKGQPVGADERRRDVLGTVFVALRMDDAIQAMTAGRPGYLTTCLMDRSDRPPRLLGGDSRCQHEAQDQAPHLARVPLDFAGRRWELLVSAHAAVPVVASLGWSWLVSVGGVVLSTALGALLLVMTGHTRRIEEAMALARREKATAEAANLAKSEFLSRMSHELRTPLNAVLGFAQVMEIDRQAPLPPPQKQRLQQIQQAGWHLLDMIDDVLDLSRIDTGTLKLNTTLVALPQVLDAALKMVEDLARQRQVTLLSPHLGDAGWAVRADATRLRQILINLVSNAVKYNRTGGTVMVSTAVKEAASGAVMSIAVQDNGLGMSPEQQSQLFQPFNRLGRERVAPDGVGIGLVVSQHLAQLMGGQLEVISREGVGSTFTLSLPAERVTDEGASGAAAPLPSPPVKDAPPSTPPPPAHVLYVEDNQANSEVVRGALASRPWIQLSVAPTTEAGLAVMHDRLRGPLPDLVLLDVHLPDASGLEFLGLMKANPQTARIPVIMISADAMPERVDAALAAGASCYLTKPVQLPALLMQVDELLAQGNRGADGRP